MIFFFPGSTPAVFFEEDLSEAAVIHLFFIYKKRGGIFFSLKIHTLVAESPLYLNCKLCELKRTVVKQEKCRIECKALDSQ
jgi:hypothetical protein